MNSLCCCAAFCFHSNARIAAGQWIDKSTMSIIPGDDPEASSWNHTCCSAPSHDLESRPSDDCTFIERKAEY